MTAGQRTILVTGGASGIGLATARLWQQRGARVVLWDVNEVGLQQAGRALGVPTVVVDVTDAAQVADGLAALGELDGVVHAAGILRTGLFHDMSLADKQRLIHVNLTGTVIMAHAAIPYLRPRRGSLILLASTSAFYGPPEFATYAATKAAVLNLAQSLRLELAAGGVHVGVVCPFFVSTPMLAASENTRLFRRFGVDHTPEEVAAAIVRGMQRRRFMIWPNGRPAFFHWLSHMTYPLSHQIMRFFWRG